MPSSRLQERLLELMRSARYQPHGGLRLRELRELAGGVDYAAVQMAIARFAKRIPPDRALAKLAMRATRMLNVEM